MEKAVKFLENFTDYIDEEKWNLRFDVPLEIYLEKMADPSLKVFMGMDSVKFVSTSPLKGEVANPPAQI